MLQALRKALALDPSDGQAHLTLALYHSYVGGFEQGLAETEKALSLNPNDADVLVIAAAILPMFGRPEQAAELADRAVQSTPTIRTGICSNLMLAYFYGGQYDQALAATRSNLNPSIYDYVYRPLTYVQLGREVDAATGSTELLQRDPEYSAERFLSDTGTFARDIELNQFLDGHRKAGLPLCAPEAQLAKYPDMKRLTQCEAQRVKSRVSSVASPDGALAVLLSRRRLRSADALAADQIAQCSQLGRCRGHHRHSIRGCRRRHGAGAGSAAHGRRGCRARAGTVRAQGLRRLPCGQRDRRHQRAAARLKSTPDEIDALDFVARMWRGAESMVMMQQSLFGAQLDFTGEELANIIAFAHDPQEQQRFSEADVPPAMRRLIREQ